LGYRHPFLGEVKLDRQLALFNGPARCDKLFD
jgi:hypothetical protein